MEQEPTVFVGVDWASEEYQVCLIGPKGPVQRAFVHDAAGLGAMAKCVVSQADSPLDVAVRSRHRQVRWSRC